MLTTWNGGVMLGELTERSDAGLESAAAAGEQT